MVLDYQPRMALLAKQRTPVEKQARELGFETPENILRCARAYFPKGVIYLDAATREGNPTRARAYFTPEKSGLARPWTPGRRGTWVNPPYGKAYRGWMAKLCAESDRGICVIALLPCNRFEQGYMHEVFNRADTVCWVRKRVAFLRPPTQIRPFFRPVAKGNPYASMVLGFNVEQARFGQAFGSLGCCLSTAPIASTR